ncbi:hypothetical protein PHMEG_00020611 [Phytophthora megakarya]|uniref:Uncharacterized protein n=1 Tax=Phytophthora megakarya TaxID=4795 RepID=A0A225VR91_9STRA|nr:hypothetical protein PHMEG_00020611 [Phytophthora megakarya]
MECKFLKVRWSPLEVVMLTEEWTDVCIRPDAKSLKIEDMNKAIFEKFNARCARTKQIRRSPEAVVTQRGRMVQFAKFVVEFDRNAIGHGRRPWFDLSVDEQLKIDIPNEWKRQVTTFTQELLNTFKQIILPLEHTHAFGKRKKMKKLVTKRKKISIRSSKSQQKMARVEHPYWTTQEKVLLAQRWGYFMKHEQLTLTEFETMPYDKSCTFLAFSARSSFSAWRKSRTLLSSWKFINTFNKQHDPGWFELTESERDVLIAWSELPDNFEDLDRDVFASMDEVVHEDTKPVTETPVQPLVPFSSKLYSTLLGPTPLLTDLCPKKEPIQTDDTLDRLLFEDDGDMEEQQTMENLAGNFVSDACFLLTNDEGPIKKEKSSEISLEPLPIRENAVQRVLESKLKSHKNQVYQVLRHLQDAVDSGYGRTLETIRAGKFDTTAGHTKHLNLVLEQQHKRMMSALRQAQETCTDNDAEMHSLKQDLFGERVGLVHF